MGRRAPSYEPRSFETRYGECTIERGTIRLEEGPSRFVRRTVEGVRGADLDALGKPALFLFTVLGTLSTVPGVVSRASDGALLATVGGLLIVVGFVWQCYRWLGRWLFDPSEIRCSDVESVSRVADDTLRIEYKDGPRRSSHDLKLPRRDTDDARRAATRGFEAKGFEVGREEHGKWYERIV